MSSLLKTVMTIYYLPRGVMTELVKSIEKLFIKVQKFKNCWKKSCDDVKNFFSIKYVYDVNNSSTIFIKYLSHCTVWNMRSFILFHPYFHLEINTKIVRSRISWRSPGGIYNLICNAPVTAINSKKKKSKFQPKAVSHY